MILQFIALKINVIYRKPPKKISDTCTQFLKLMLEYYLRGTPPLTWKNRVFFKEMGWPVPKELGSGHSWAKRWALKETSPLWSPLLANALTLDHASKTEGWAVDHEYIGLWEQLSHNQPILTNENHKNKIKSIRMHCHRAGKRAVAGTCLPHSCTGLRAGLLYKMHCSQERLRNYSYWYV